MFELTICRYYNIGNCGRRDKSADGQYSSSVSRETFSGRGYSKHTGHRFR